MREFVPGDIPGVVDLRSRAFAESERATRDDLAAYFERIFFGNPWRSEGLPSLVHVEGSGRIGGFLGVVPRRARYAGAEIQVAVCTQFMAGPESRALGAVQLVKTLLAGRQDLTFADAANDASRAMWERLGGSVAPVQSLTWTQPLRRARFRMAEATTGVVSRGVARLLRPVLALVDLARSRWSAPAALEELPLTPELMASRLDSVLDGVTLHPSYDPASTRWLLDQLHLKRWWGHPGGAALRDANGEIAGWYLYNVNYGGVGDVVQVVAGRGRHRAVFESLCHHAWRHGLVALAGRGDRELLPVLDPASARVSRRGPWALVHSRHAGITDAIRRGDAYFSRLDGEWWMSF